MKRLYMMVGAIVLFLAGTIDASAQTDRFVGVRKDSANEASIRSGAGRLENTYAFKASLGYELSRFWSVYLDYAYEQREANFSINEFERQIIQTGIVTRF